MLTIGVYTLTLKEGLMGRPSTNRKNAMAKKVAKKMAPEVLAKAGILEKENCDLRSELNKIKSQERAEAKELGKENRTIASLQKRNEELDKQLNEAKVDLLKVAAELKTLSEKPATGFVDAKETPEAVFVDATTKQAEVTALEETIKTLETDIALKNRKIAKLKEEAMSATPSPKAAAIEKATRLCEDYQRLMVDNVEMGTKKPGYWNGVEVLTTLLKDAISNDA